MDAIALSTAQRALKAAKQNVRTVTANATLTRDDDTVFADATGFGMPKLSHAVVAAAGGAFAAGDYYWVATAIDAQGNESQAQVGVAANMQLNQKATLTWAVIPGATAYRIYRGPINLGNPTIVDPRLVAQVAGGATTTYVDTGSATTAPAPPAKANFSFIVTLPAVASVPGKHFRVIANSESPNTVTLAAAGGELIAGAASLKLGVTADSDYRAVEIVSTGTSWMVVNGWKAAITAVQGARVYPTNCNNGVATILVVLKVPRLIPGVSKINFKGSAEATPAAGVTQHTLSINRCDVNGAIPASGGNIAFWRSKFQAVSAADVTAQRRDLLSVGWLYDPRPGDQNLGYGDNEYVGLHMTAAGGTSSVTSVMFDAFVGSFQSAYWPNP